MIEENNGAFFTNEAIAKCNENVQKLVQERQRAERLSREEAESKTMQAIANGTERSGFFTTLIRIIAAIVLPLISAIVARKADAWCSVM